MRKIIIFILIILLIVINIYSVFDKEEMIRKKEEIRAIFISYIEINKYINNLDIKNNKINIKKIIKNVKNLGFNTIILQVRSMTDAIYFSSLFPCGICDNEEEKLKFDILKYFIDEAKKDNISIYAWVNPYRVRTANNKKTITENNPVYKYIGTNYLYEGDGVFLNPAKEEVIDLIVDGVLEIVKNYDVKGVIFDDYFYPNKEIDIEDYSNYVAKNGYIDIDSYRLENVNKLIKKTYEVCHKYNKLFGVSPDGNIENNYNKHYADVKKWGSNSNYVDFLMPQIYYGFFNEVKDFNSTIHEWESIVKDSNVGLVVALAFYKVGSLDQFAKGGSEEWILNSDIIKREIILSRNLNNYKGFALFRYGFIFDKDLASFNTEKEKENILDVID